MNQRLDFKRNDSLSIVFQQYVREERTQLKQPPQDGPGSPFTKTS
jgi:hypothetical protein